MFSRGADLGPPSRRLRAVAWLVVAVMLHAGGLGHLLHPWLHGHAPRQAPPAAGLHEPASVKAHDHGPCVLCAFLAHYLARASAPWAAGMGGPACPGQTALRGEEPLPAPDRRLCASRSPPHKAVI